MAIAGLGVATVLALWFSTWAEQANVRERAAAFIVTLVSAAPFALIWIGASWGFGRAACLALGGARGLPAPVHLGVGMAIMMWLASVLGSLGIFQLGGLIGAWLVIAIGAALALTTFQRERDRERGKDRAARFLPAGTLLIAAPALAVLFVAACSAPGWLWATEFGGYDALTYHLQLPKEWIELGRVTPLEHNVYSFLPGFTEAAFYHLMVMRGDAIEGAIIAQTLHAMIAVATAWTLARLVASLTRNRGGESTDGFAPLIAAAIVIGTPWVIVTGSLAYNELFVAFFLACALFILLSERGLSTRDVAIVALLAAAAIGAKLTAAGMVALPIAIICAMRLSAPRWPAALAIACGVLLVTLAPYLVRNAMHAGNPVFPFATDVFGAAHWTEEQVRTWRDGHTAGGGAGVRLRAVWDQLLRYGFGSAPDRDPWKPQWSILFWLAAAGAIAALAARKHQRIVIALLIVLGAQLLFWMFATHLKSRFMLPAIIPAAALVALGTDAVTVRFLIPLRTSRARAAGTVIVGAILFAWCIEPVLLYRAEGRDIGGPSARVGWHSIFTGEGLSPQARLDFAAREPTVYLNFIMPAASRTLLVGATPFYFITATRFATVWDRGPLERAMEESDDPAAWFRAVREAGFDHLLVDAGMIHRLWEPRRPQLGAARIVRAADAHTELIHVFDERLSLRLYRLRE